MKTLIASALFSVAVLAAVQTNAQIASVKHEKKAEKRAEKKVERKALRHLRENEVSTAAKDNFSADFPGAKNVSWNHNTMFDEATFTDDNGETKTAFYGYDTNLVGTVTPKKYEDLPQAARKEITKQFKGYTPGAVLMYDDNESNDSDMYLYGMQFEGRDHYFVTVSKGPKESVLMVSMDGNVSFFKDLK
ncbi:hypothetical protein GCM10023091_39990 [Ravibacter arvi]|uniref:Beta-lactamase-inhibitor-like PepSY-like domain-containing protein n=1 Tax=Ravibacter arvi TaxID=2051041 RepID=A0ABP8MBZ5_9BACT